MGISSRLFGRGQSGNVCSRSEIDITDTINAHMRREARQQRCLAENFG